MCRGNRGQWRNSFVSGQFKQLTPVLRGKCSMRVGQPCTEQRRAGRHSHRRRRRRSPAAACPRPAHTGLCELASGGRSGAASASKMAQHALANLDAKCVLHRHMMDAVASIDCLIDQLRCPHSSARAQEQAACALWHVAAHCEGYKALVATTAVTTLVTCLQSSSAGLREQAAGMLCSLSSGSLPWPATAAPYQSRSKRHREAAVLPPPPPRV